MVGYGWSLLDGLGRLGVIVSGKTRTTPLDSCMHQRYTSRRHPRVMATHHSQHLRTSSCGGCRVARERSTQAAYWRLLFRAIFKRWFCRFSSGEGRTTSGIGCGSYFWNQLLCSKSVLPKKCDNFLMLSDKPKTHVQLLAREHSNLCKMWNWKNKNTLAIVRHESDTPWVINPINIRNSLLTIMEVCLMFRCDGSLIQHVNALGPFWTK